MKKNWLILAGAGLLSLSISATAFASPATVKSYVKFRSAPSTSSTVYETLKPGTAIDVQQEVNAYWLKVTVNGKVGYLSPNYITYEPAPTAPKTTPATVVRSVNFRSAPSTNSTIYANLKPGTSISVLEKVSAYWLKVEVNGKTGYLSPSYLEYGQAPSPAPTPSPAPSPASKTAEKVIQHAKDLEGITHYAYGVNKAPTLLDCSAFTKYVFGQEGITLKWGTRYQKDAGVFVARGDLQPGDLVFFRVGSSSEIGHVGIYIGDGRFIHNSPSFDGVGISSMTSGYWDTRYVTARRVI